MPQSPVWQAEPPCPLTGPPADGNEQFVLPQTLPLQSPLTVWRLELPGTSSNPELAGPTPLCVRIAGHMMSGQWFVTRRGTEVSRGRGDWPTQPLAMIAIERKAHPLREFLEDLVLLRLVVYGAIDSLPAMSREGGELVSMIMMLVDCVLRGRCEVTILRMTTLSKGRCNRLSC